MATFAELRRFGLALPGVIEHPHMGQPSFDVSPEIFTPCPVGTGMWSYVDIGKLNDKELQGLIIEAWSQVTTKRARDQYHSIAARTKSSGSRQNSRHRR